MLKNLFLLPLLASAACAGADSTPPATPDPAALAAFLEQQAGPLGKEEAERARKLDTAAASIAKAPVERSDNLILSLAGS